MLARICDYLAALGVGAVYCSPLLKSAAGSTHGYDVVDHRLIDPARGVESSFDRTQEPDPPCDEAPAGALGSDRQRQL